MEGLATAGMVDMTAITGSAEFDMANFKPEISLL